MKKNVQSPLLLAAFLAITSQPAWSQQGDDTDTTQQGEASTEESSTSWGVNGGDIYQFDTDLDGGGSFSVNRFFIGGGIDYKLSPSLSLDFNIGVEVDDYNFSGAGPLMNSSGGNPWSTVTDVTFKALARWKVDDQWRIFLGGLVSWTGETSAEAGDSFTGGALMGFAHTFSEDLTLGFGMQISTRLEDSLLFIPSPIIDWRISEQFFISNVRGPVTFPASLGVEAVYYLSRELNISIGTRYEYRRFRLDDDGPARVQNGIGLDSSFPVWGRFEWRPVPQIRIHLLAGVAFGERLRLYDSDGNQLAEQDVDPAPFVGFFLGFDF